MPIRVEGPDNVIVEFPDDTPPEVMRDAMRKKFGAQKAPTPDIATDIAKGVGYGANTGIDALLNTVGAVARVPMNYASRALGYGDAFPELELARRANVAGPAETMPGRVAQNVSEVVGGSLFPSAGFLAAGRGATSAAPAILQAYGQAPAATAATDALAATGAGLGMSYAKENELGPLAEAALGLAGGYALPNVANMAARSYAAAISAGAYAGDAARAARNPEAAAYRNVARKGVQSGLDFDAMRKSISPELSKQLRDKGLEEDDLADIISRQLRGEHPEDIVADYTGKLTPSTARNYLKRYQDKNPTPLNVVDTAKLTAGEGKAMPITRYARAAHSIAGGEDASAAEALINRQEMQPGRVAQIFEKRMGAGNFEANKRAHAEALKKESDKAYEAFYAEPDLAIDDLADLMEEPLFRTAVQNAKRQERLSIISRNQANRNMGKPTEPVPNIEEATDVFSPQLLDLIQRDLRLSGQAFSNPNEARYAQDLREVFLDRIEKFYPSFRGLRHTYASGKMEQEAFDAGVKLTSKLGTKTNEALADFDTMTPAQKNIFRESFGAALRDKAANTPRGNQVANPYSSEGFRQIIERLYPKKDKKLFDEGQKLLSELNAERVTTRTKNDILSGSRTAELASDMDVINTPAEAAANAFTGNWLGIMRTLGKRLTQQIGTEGARQSLKILSETDPAQLLPMLTRLAKEAKTVKEREAYVATLNAFKKVGRRPAVEVGTLATAGE